MKRSFYKIASAGCILLLGAASGCKQKPSDDEAVRTAVRQHLSSLGTLNMQAFETDFANVSIQNNQATADVSFRPKTGAPAGAAMQVSYQLEKKEGNWKVVKKSTPGGMIQHPDPNANPHTPPARAKFTANCPIFRKCWARRIHSLTPSNSLRPPAQNHSPTRSATGICVLFASSVSVLLLLIVVRTMVIGSFGTVAHHPCLF